MVLYTIIFLLIINDIKLDINVHVVSHSHHDPGWIMTVDKYYDFYVKNIYKNIFFNILTENINRTYVICEIINFRRFYELDCDEEQKNIIKNHIINKQVEFVGGGLVMNDEATPYYTEIIDQLRLGLQFIKNEFNYTVKTGWYLDSFGHSNVNTYINSILGYENLVINRIDKQEFKTRFENKTLEFFWKPFKQKKDQILTHILGLHYGVSSFSSFLTNESEYSFTNSNENILLKETIKFSNLIYDLIDGYQHKEYLFLLGDDFTFNRTNTMFKKIEKFMEILDLYQNKKNSTISNEQKKFFFNSLKKNEKINIFYSTTENYFESIKTYHNNLKTEENIDFFPYSDKSNSYWTGYYTSRPFLKGYINHISNYYLIFSKLLFEYRLKYLKYIDGLNNLKNLIGLLMHHDAITGTSKILTNSNYINFINDNLTFCNEKIINLTNSIFNEHIEISRICLSNPIVNFGCNNSFDISDDIFNENNEIEKNITIFNPGIEGKVLITIEIKNSNKNYYIKDYYNNIIESDFYCANKDFLLYGNLCFLNFFYNFDKNILFSSIKLIKSFNDIKNMQNLIDFKKNINDTYFELIKNKKFIKNLNYNISNNFYDISIFNKVKNKIEKYNFRILGGKYEGYVYKANNKNITLDPTRPLNSNINGAYIFTPTTEFPTISRINPNVTQVFIGNLSTNIINININQSYSIISIFYDPFFIKLDTISFPFNNTDCNFVILFQCNINNSILINNKKEFIFYTENNGMDTLKRITNYRSNYNITDNEIVTSNFYPIVGSISIKDSLRRVTIYNDRSQSASSMREGEIIIIYNRQSTRDDERGLGEKLYEWESSTNYFKISHIIKLGEYDYNFNDFIYNYFHNSPAFFISNNLFENVTSTLNKFIICSKNIRSNYQIIKDIIIGEYFFEYKNDKYINKGIININGDIIKDFNVKIKMDYKGIEYLDVNSFNNINKNFIIYQNNKNIQIKLNKNEFLFLYFYFLFKE